MNISKQEFTPEERFLISYYRDHWASSRGRVLALGIGEILVPLVFAGLYFRSGDGAWLFVSMALLLYRAARSVASTWKYNNGLRSLVLKYEARVKELEEKAGARQ